MVTLENDILQISVCRKGAELRRLYHKRFQQDYLWNADPKYWGKYSPVLFPVVGTLLQNEYLYKGRKYTLPRHGFARDMPFEIETQKSDAVIFLLESSTETLVNYPFDFALRIGYHLQEDTVAVSYTVSNTCHNEDMYFSLGAHPAFKVPLMDTDHYDDYRLRFEGSIDAAINPLHDGLLLKEKKPITISNNTLPLSTTLFSSDALVFTGKIPESIVLEGLKTKRGLRFGMKGWPHLGLWAAPNAPFLCIEPWQGHADFTDHDQTLENKAGIVKLKPQQQWENQWQVSCY